MGGAGRRALFLDRDGTVIEDRHYLAEADGVALLPGAAEAIARANAAALPVILVTNQSGIGRGFFSETQYGAVHTRLVELLHDRGARLDASYHCPDGPAVPSQCRKPAAGMFVHAAREHGLDLGGSWFVGDRVRDVLPAQAFGARAILVRSPQSELDQVQQLPWVTVVDSLAAAVEHLLGETTLD